VGSIPISGAKFKWADSVNGEHGCFASSKVGIVTPSVHQVLSMCLAGSCTPLPIVGNVNIGVDHMGPFYLCVLSARSDGRLWKSEVAGSNPATQTKSVVLVR
jgi:hypothetical protein